MAVTQNDEIVKQQVVDIFKSNLLSAIFTSNLNHSGSVPTFSGTAGGISTAAGTSKTYTNPYAIDPGQLDSNAQPSVSISNAEISAADTYNSLKGIIDKLTKIRNYSSSWYYQSNDSTSLVATKSGTAIFKATIPGLTAYSTSTKVDGATGWARSVTGTSAGVGSSATTTSTLTVTNPFVQNQEAKAGQVQPRTTNGTLFKNLFDAWNTAKGKTITYTYYTCHSNCHSNWTDVRSRR